MLNILFTERTHPYLKVYPCFHPKCILTYRYPFSIHQYRHRELPYQLSDTFCKIQINNGTVFYNARIFEWSACEKSSIILKLKTGLRVVFAGRLGSHFFRAGPNFFFFYSKFKTWPVLCQSLRIRIRLISTSTGNCYYHRFELTIIPDSEIKWTISRSRSRPKIRRLQNSGYMWKEVKEYRYYLFKIFFRIHL